MKESAPQQSLHLCLQNQQKFETAALIASTQNSWVFDLTYSQKEGQQRMAVKVYSHNSSPPAVLSHLLYRPHKHLVNILRIVNGPPAFVCMELCKQDLKDFLHPTQFLPLSHAEVNRVGREIVEGLLELKSMRLMHGDVKPQNILVDPSGVVKLGDLDFVLREEQFSKKRMRLGTLEYMAPEILSSWACSYASDVWSLGIVLFELHFGRHPFPQLQELDPSQESAIPSAFAIIKDHLERTRESIKAQLAQLRESSSSAVRAVLQAMLGCLVWEAASRARLQQVGVLLAAGGEVVAVRKGSWSTDCTGLPGEDDIFMFPNSGLLLAFEKLRTILSCLPEEAHKLKEIMERSARLENEQKEGTMGVEVEALRGAIGVKFKRMERNFKRLANLEGGVEYSRKGELFIHLKYLLELLDETAARYTQSQWIRDNCTRSAEQLQ